VTLRARFDRFVIKSDGGCWIWSGAKNRKGYGRFRFEGRNRYAHQVAYIIAHGSIPTGSIVCHTCDVPACVNPMHLYAGSHRDNATDRSTRGRHGRCNAKKTHCPYGHPYSPENTYVRKNRKRECRTCVLSAVKVRYQRLKAAL
jgi:hypothetical protein